MALAGCCSPSIGVMWAPMYMKQQSSSNSRVRWHCSLWAVCKAVFVDNRRIVLTKVPLHTAALCLLARRWSINHADPHSLWKPCRLWIVELFSLLFLGVGWLLCNSILFNKACFYWWRTVRCVLNKVPDRKRRLPESRSGENQCLHNIPNYPKCTQSVKTFSLTWATMLMFQNPKSFL